VAEIVSLAEAVALAVRNGDTVAMEGFTHLIPHAAGHEVIRQRRTGLTLVRMTPDVIYDQLIGAVGFGDGPGCRQRLGLTGAGPRKIITDLGVLEPDPVTSELALTGVCPGVSVKEVQSATGWDLSVSARLQELPPPAAAELAALRALRAATRGSEGAN